MGLYVGVDWASRGWLTVTVDGDGWAAKMHPSIHSVWFTHREADSILVDIPIGLPENRRRECDDKAKEFLSSGRARSVFWTPCREAVEADTYDEAKGANKDCRGDSLSSQAWGLTPRIQEVDRLLRDDDAARRKIRESHPEVCFKALRQGDQLGSKHGDSGIEERSTLLETVEDSMGGVYDDFVSHYIDEQPPWARRIGNSNRDDLLDAMVLAVTAKLGGGDYETLPSDPPTDNEGLPMEIVYAEP